MNLEKTTCNSCGNDRISILFTDASTGMSLVKCKHCGLAYLNPRLTDIDSVSFYEASFSSEKQTGVGLETINSNTWYQNYLVKLVLDSFPEAKGNILEVGCGTGTLLSLLKETGWNVTGLDISKSAAKTALEKHGIQVFATSLLDTKFPAESFDAILCVHTLEHLSNPSETLAEMYRILKKEGILIVGVPNFGFYGKFIGRVFHTLKIFIGELLGIDITRYGFRVHHLYYFSPKTLKMMLAQAGYESIRFYFPAKIHLYESYLMLKGNYMLLACLDLLYWFLGLMGNNISMVACARKK